jgi:phosphoribosylformylglycinamidine synthase
MTEVIKFAGDGGYVWGICNGFQILCEAGLLPGVLLRNHHQKFICKNVYLKPMTKNTVITATLDLNTPLKIPIAHAEGRFHVDTDTLEGMYHYDQILFKYCDENGQITEETNPNGALDNIAGICNRGKNVFGMMPHPERASEKELRNTDGRELFQSLINTVSAQIMAS